MGLDGDASAGDVFIAHNIWFFTTISIATIYYMAPILLVLLYLQLTVLTPLLHYYRVGESNGGRNIGPMRSTTPAGLEVPP